MNGNNTDFAGGLSNAMCKDGQQVAAANQPMGNFKFTGLGSGSARTDSISLGQSQDAKANWVASGGAADAITATYSPALTALVDGQLCYFRATAANATTTPTFAPNGLTANTITKVGGTALVAGDIPGNLAECALRYNLANTRWELVNPAVPTASLGAGSLASSASGFNEPYNLQLVASVGSNLLTVAVKNTAGNDPSSSDPVIIPFRDSTATGGGNIIVKVTSALSINTNATGATLGSSSNVAFRFWVVAFNNSGSVVLALINCLNSSGNISPLNDRAVQSSTPISGSANTAGVFYTPNGTTVTNKSICVLGYIEYNSTGLATAGTFNTAPNFVQLAGPHTPRPGYEVQRQYAGQPAATSMTGAGTTSFATVSGLSATLTPTSAANLIEVSGSLNASVSSVSGNLYARFARGSTGIAIGNAGGGSQPQATMELTSFQANSAICGSMIYIDIPNTASSLTYNFQVSAINAQAIGINEVQSDSNSSQKGRYFSFIQAREIMA